MARALLASLVLAGGPTAAAHSQCTPEWDLAAATTAVEGQVLALAVYDSGSGPELYAGGNFWSIGGIAAPSGFAKFDGSTWIPLGSGVISGGGIRVMTVADLGTGPRLYLGGFFSGVGGNGIFSITAFDGTSFSEVAGGCAGGGVTDLAVLDLGTGPELYACGSFTAVQGQAASGFARYDGTNWTPVGPVSGYVGQIHVHRFPGEPTPSLYLGGQFSGLSPTGIVSVARYDATGITSAGLLLDDSVQAMASFEGDLYVAGDFVVAGGYSSPALVRSDGFAWTNPVANVTVPLEAVRTLVPTTLDGVPHLAIGSIATNSSTNAGLALRFFDGFTLTEDGSTTDDGILTLLELPSAIGTLEPGLVASGVFPDGSGATSSEIRRYGTCAPAPRPTFRRGDANGDGGLNIADAIRALGVMFLGLEAPPCLETLDVNDDGSANVADVTTLLATLFVPGAPPPPPPVTTCGTDNDTDAISCDDTGGGC